MYLTKLPTLLIVSLFALTSVAQSEDQDALIREALDRAGENRGEIESALESVSGEQVQGMRFLVANMPDQDLRELSAEFLVDNVRQAYLTWENCAWKDQIPEHIFLNNVLPYINVSEQRDPWRAEFLEKFGPLVEEARSLSEAAVILNQKVFPMVGVRYSRDRRRADQSPLESMETGTASCTGLSILLVDACRAVGVPARLVGTPLWSDRSGNHTWVEIWDDGWHFTGACEPTGDELNRGWFIGRASGADRDHRMHAIYAVSFQRTPITFPMVWARGADDVYAVNVTDRYTAKTEPLPEGMVRIRFRAQGRNGRRESVAVSVFNGSDSAVFEGTTKDERFDGNDHLTARLEQGETYQAVADVHDRKINLEFVANKDEQLVTFDISAPAGETDANGSSDTSDPVEFDKETRQALKEALELYFATKPEDRDPGILKSNWNQLLRSHDQSIRDMVWQAYLEGSEVETIREDFKEDVVRYGEFVSPYVVKEVGERPEGGWPLFIAMHGGGGVPKRVNDSQWAHMQIYYRDQESVEGYKYLALRAPTDQWNGFYTSYNLPLTANLIRQFVALGDVNPDRVFLMGYSHGGYGAFWTGRLMADRFAAVHASAAAPTLGNEPGKNLRNTRFTFMIGENDTAYGREPRCRSFAEYMDKLKQDNEGEYPVEFEYQKGYGHGGLPDRDKISSMYEYHRQTVPRRITWLTSASEIGQFSWIELAEPRGGIELDATCRDNRVELTTSQPVKVALLFDERLVDWDQPIELVVNGEASAKTLEPSLATLCETLAQRGDPALMFACRVVIEPAE